MSSPTENKYEFKAEIRKLLDILSKSLYQHKEVFLREMISNSSDALSKMRFIQLQNKDVEELPLEVEISFNSKEKILIVRDTGVGMTKKELIDNLGTIAGSGSAAFLKTLKETSESKQKELDLDIIGQFGVGFYSVFMVAQKVKVISKSYIKDEPAHAWESDGSGEFTVTPCERATRGTDVIIFLRDEETEYLAKYRLQDIVQKYSNYIPFPIYVKDEGKKEVDVSTEEEAKAAETGAVATGQAHGETKPETKKEEKKEERKPVNELVPIWKRTPAELKPEDYRKFYQFIAKRYDEYAHVIHYNVEGQVVFNSIVYVPESPSPDVMQPDIDYGLTLYSKKVMIVEYCKDVIPKWMRFVRGMVDSEDIPLNVSRDTIQNSRVIMKISDLLAKKFVSEMVSLAEKDPKKYNKIWKEFSFFFKEGMVNDPQHKEALLKLLRFNTSKAKNNELRGLDDYIKSMTKEQQETKKEIYYLIGENLNTMRISPHMGHYTKNDIEVIFFAERVDNFLMMNLHDYKVTTGEGDSKKEVTYTFVPIDTTGPSHKHEEGKEADKKEGKDKDKVEEKEPEVPEATKKFLDFVKVTLGNKIMDAKVSDRLYESPFRLANPSDGMTSSMQRVMRYWTQKFKEKEFQVPQKILEFNPNHPMVQELIQLHEKDPENGRLKPVLKQIFDNCLLSEGDLPEPAAMVPRINQLLEMLVLRKDDVKNPADAVEQEQATAKNEAGADAEPEDEPEDEAEDEARAKPETEQNPDEKPANEPKQDPASDAGKDQSP
nr:molecular chaperone HtpG [Candidatus Sigynarchaeota archaeon]